MKVCVRIVGAGRPAPSRNGVQPVGHVRLGADQPKRPGDPLAAAVVGRGWRERSHAAQVRLVEGDHATRAQGYRELAQGRGQVGLKDQDIPPDGHGVGGLVEGHGGGITLAEGRVAQSSGPPPVVAAAIRGRGLVPLITSP